MKIAVASEGKKISQHFGHCECFTIYDVQCGKIINRDVKDNPGHECHKPGIVPAFLKQIGANAVIAGGMGQKAQDFLKQDNIEVFTGIGGMCDDAVLAYIDGNLKSSGNVCKNHEHHEHNVDCNG